MEFFFSLVFLVTYYIRPQDWVPGLTGANLIKPIMAAWLLALFAGRSRPTLLPGALRTPHDWVMLGYFIYVVWTAPDTQGALTGFLPLVMFYALTVQSLSGWDRLLRYLKWWNGCLVAVALMAVLSEHGIDLTGARPVTDAYGGRLSLNTWLHNNPNALAHSVVVIIPLSYVLYFWRSNTTSRLFIFPALAGIAFYCAWMTQSKGSFVVGGLLVTLIFVIGRPKFVQILAIGTALTLGVSALSFLPRMSEMSNLRGDEGVQGRLLAWEMARAVTRNEPTGIGWKQFIAYIPWTEGRQQMIVRKATHSSYVQIGADLGRYGLFFYLAGLWCGLHTLIRVKPRDEMEERCRRAAFLILAGYALSGWMINREYHTEYFLLIGVIASVHRLYKNSEAHSLSQERGGDEAVSPTPPPDPGTAPPSPSSSPAFSTRIEVLANRWRPLWNRFGLIDLGVSAGLTWLAFWTWDYLLTNL